MIDIDKQVKNPALVSSIRDMVTHYTEEKEKKFLSFLFDATFLSPIESTDIGSENAAGKEILKSDISIKLLHLSNEKQEAWLPIFTDWEEVSKAYNRNCKTMLLQLTDYQAILNKDDKYAGVSINPYGENIILSKQNINAVLEQHNTIKKGEKIQIGEPAKYPKKLMQSLCSLFSTMSSVNAAYLLYMVKNNEGSYLLVVDTENPEGDFPIIGKASVKCLGGGELLDLMPLNSQLGKSSCNDKEPFYKK